MIVIWFEYNWYWSARAFIFNDLRDIYLVVAVSFSLLHWVLSLHFISIQLNFVSVSWNPFYMYVLLFSCYQCSNNKNLFAVFQLCYVFDMAEPKSERVREKGRSNAIGLYVIDLRLGLIDAARYWWCSNCCYCFFCHFNFVSNKIWRQIWIRRSAVTVYVKIQGQNLSIHACTVQAHTHVTFKKQEHVTNSVSSILIRLILSSNLKMLPVRDILMRYLELHKLRICTTDFVLSRTRKKYGLFNLTCWFFWLFVCERYCCCFVYCFPYNCFI